MEGISLPLSESQIQELLYYGDVSLAVWGQNGRMIDINTPTLDFFGFSAKEDFHKNYDGLSPLYQPDGNLSKETMLQKVKYTFEQGRTDFDWLHKKRNGCHIDCHIHMVIGEYAEEKVVCAFVRASYIDEELPQSAPGLPHNAGQKGDRFGGFHEMLEHAPMGCYLYDNKLQVVDMNQHIAKLHGRDSKAAMNRLTIADCAPEFQPNGEPSTDYALKTLTKAFEVGIYKGPWTIKTQNGTEIDCDSTIVRVEYRGEPALLVYLRETAMEHVNVKRLHEQQLAERGVQLIVDNMPFGCHFLDKNYQITYCNQAAVALHGFKSKQDFIDRFNEFIPEFQPDGRPSVEVGSQHAKTAFEKGYSRVEWSHNKPDGTLIPTESTLIRVKSQDEYILLNFMRDLTDVYKIRLEALQKEQEVMERWTIINEALPIGINFWDENLNFLDGNEMGYKLFGFPSKDNWRENWQASMPEFQPDGTPSLEKMTEGFQITIAEGNHRFKWIHHSIEGEPILLDITLVRVKYKEGYMVVCILQDLRRLQEADTKVREAEISRQFMYDSIPIPASIWDENYRVLDCNEAMINFLQLSGKEEALERFYEFSTDYQPCGTSSKEKCVKVIDQVLGEGTTIKHHWNHLVGGEVIPVEVTVERVPMGEGYVCACYAFDLRPVMEITEEANRAKTRFLARMSHEIRTPITAVLGISEIQLHDPDIPPHIESAFTKIHDSGTLLLGIVNDILDFSKIESGKLPLVHEEYEMASMVSDATQLHFVYLEHKNIKFNVHVNSLLPRTFIGDQLRIRQIMNNLLSNAFKYTESGCVTLSLTYENKQDDTIVLVISIKDTGRGLSKDQLDSLKSNNEYIRFHEQENRSVGGTGLGISIVTSLVQMMGGHIDFSSEVNKGTDITVSIPQKIVGPEVLGKEAAESLQSFAPGFGSMAKKFNFEPMPYGSVLVVDDVDTNLFVAQGLLAFYELKIDTCESGKSAIDKIRQGNVYDIVFMDHMMPEMNGMEAMHILREMGYNHPIVALTANAIVGQAEEFMLAGFDDFVSKPIQTKRLNYVLNKFIRDKQVPKVIEAAKNKKKTDSETDSETDSGTDSATDSLSAINNYLSDADLVKKLRADFAKGHKNTFQDLERALALDDIKTAHRLAHTLKGLAALIQEDTLSKIAKEVECLLAKGKIPAGKQLTTLGDELVRVLESIGVPDITVATTGKPFDKKRAKEVLDKLGPLLESCNAESYNLLDELRPIPESGILVRQIEDFEFGLALISLKTLKAVLDM